MSINLIDLFKSTMSDVLVHQASAMLDESAESTSSAVNKIFPALLNAMIIRGSTERGAQDLLDYMRSNKIDEALHDDVPTLLSGGPETAALTNDGAGILKHLFGDKLNYLVDWVSSGNGLKTSSASTLLKLIAPLMMGAIARAVRERSLNASGLRDLLLSQKEFVDASSPAAITELLGITYEAEKTVHGSLEGAALPPPEREGSLLSKLLPWIVLLIAALGLFYFLEKGGGPPPVDMDKMKRDSLENVRRMDSIRNQTYMDSIKNQMRIDSLNAIQPDTLVQ